MTADVPVGNASSPPEYGARFDFGIGKPLDDDSSSDEVRSGYMKHHQ